MKKEKEEDNGYESVEQMVKQLAWLRRIRRYTRRGMQEKPYKQMTIYRQIEFKKDCNHITLLSGKIEILVDVLNFLKNNEKLVKPLEHLNKLKDIIKEMESV